MTGSAASFERKVLAVPGAAERVSEMEEAMRHTAMKPLEYCPICRDRLRAPDNECPRHGKVSTSAAVPPPPPPRPDEHLIGEIEKPRARTPKTARSGQCRGGAW